MEAQSAKYDKDAKNYISDEEDHPKPVKKKELDENDDKLDTNFDDDSLSVYGAMLTEQLETSKPGHEKATPRALVGEIISKEEKEKRAKKKKQREIKAQQLLEDVELTDD
eukprot:CAMPEP_0170484410 /NCGR_PEP_ID=MMETSP0208-20121228/3889_1 /TAXON_ID=197538 /ORGANISM="Strombidium inclinatum, Strain S3" /LENGTH=109 /DNA_ID=CAMNT_0010757739 /DNA_START=560 /DNA_END=889 /DNA_ORIENTATION=-